MKTILVDMDDTIENCTEGRYKSGINRLKTYLSANNCFKTGQHTPVCRPVCSLFFI